MSESNIQSCLSRVHGRWVRLFAKIKYAAASSALSVVTAMTLRTAPAAGQEQAGTQSVEIMEIWGIQLSSGHSWSRAARVVSGPDDLGLTMVDLDAVWNITPHYLNRLVSDSNQHLNTAETTLGVGWRF